MADPARASPSVGSLIQPDLSRGAEALAEDLDRPLGEKSREASVGWAAILPL